LHEFIGCLTFLGFWNCTILCFRLLRGPSTSTSCSWAHRENKVDQNQKHPKMKQMIKQLRIANDLSHLVMC
jgi:hypothetical protein